MTDDVPLVHPEPGDYVVLYEPRTPYGNPRLRLVRWAIGAPPALIRATFESAEDAGPRFEGEAQSMAAEGDARAFRCVDGRYTSLDVTVDTPDR